MTSGVGVKIEQRINFRVFFGKNSKNLDLKTLFKGVKVTEEHFEAFYREFSK